MKDPVKNSTEYQREQWRIRDARRSPEQKKLRQAKRIAVRSAKRAALALAVGRTPGKTGPRKYSAEELKKSMKATQERFREKHKERLREYHTQWKRELRATPEGREYLRQLAIVNGAKRRAQKKGCAGTHTAEDIKQLWFLQHGKCAWCSQALGEEKPHVDHWIPLSKGGSNGKDNLRLLHKKCNLSKSDKLPPEFKLMGTHN